jgi:Amt family ammonium transporter
MVTSYRTCDNGRVPFLFIGTWILLKITDAIIPMRVTVQEELVGLDRSQHGEAIL